MNVLRAISFTVIKLTSATANAVAGNPKKELCWRNNLAINYNDRWDLMADRYGSDVILVTSSFINLTMLEKRFSFIFFDELIQQLIWLVRFHPGGTRFHGNTFIEINYRLYYLNKLIQQLRWLIRFHPGVTRFHGNTLLPNWLIDCAACLDNWDKKCIV